MNALGRDLVKHLGARSQAVASASGRGTRSSSNGADLATAAEAGLARTPSPRSPIAEAAVADGARSNGSQGASPDAQLTAAQLGKSEEAEEAWEPAWPTLDIDATTPAAQEGLLHGVSLGAPSAAVPVAEPEPTAAAQIIGSQQPSASRAAAVVDGPPRPPSRGGIASGIAAQLAAHSSGGEEAPDPGVAFEARQVLGSKYAASDGEPPTGSDDAAAVDVAESVSIAGRPHGGRDVASSQDDGTAFAAAHEQRADIDAAALQDLETAPG